MGFKIEVKREDFKMEIIDIKGNKSEVKINDYGIIR